MKRASPARGARFYRVGTRTRLAAICLVAVFLVGVMLIADGLLLKAEGDHGSVNGAQNRISASAGSGPAPAH